MDNQIPATLFEVTFILACLKFDEVHCDSVVIEVGLGGKLDATNVISTVCSILCSVSLDHTRILGSTVEAIAKVKAGIFKPGRPSVVGMGTPLHVLREEAAIIGSKLFLVDDLLLTADHSLSPYLSCVPKIGPDSEEIIYTDTINTNLTLAALTLLPDEHEVFATLRDGSRAQAIAEAAMSRPPCRWEMFSVPVQAESNTSPSIVTVVLDVGHNPAAVAALSKRVRRDFVGRSVR